MMLLWFQHILYRQKEQFSDGVGYSWIDGLKEHANQQVRSLNWFYLVTFVFPFIIHSFLFVMPGYRFNVS